MIIKSITPINFGPFSTGSSLVIDRELTVLTGANDTGKSNLLRIINLICSNGTADERDYNRYRVGKFAGSWQTDPELKCIVKIEYMSNDKIRGNSFLNGDIIDLSVVLSPGNRHSAIMSVFRNGKSIGISGPYNQFPNSILLPSEDEVGDRINLTKMNSAEKHLVQLAFGENFTFAHYKSLTEDGRVDYIHDSQIRFNERLKEILPPSMSLRFDFRGGDPDKLDVMRIAVVDAVRGVTPLGFRGTGIRKIASIVGALLSLSSSNKSTCVLLDEPETSLHADVQHALRRLLEVLASRPNIQVIYATHSPSMINTLRPTSIRVLKRHRSDERATSVIVNDAFDKNYYTVRSSLGLNAADSLLYAPITVIVEGASEVRCLPLIFKKFKMAGIKGFEDADIVLSQTHFLDGGGDSFEYLCRLAKSQGAKPVIFLDGDKTGGGSLRLTQKVREHHPEVAIVTLPIGEEFEQVVPIDKYLEAVSTDIGDSSGVLTLPNYEVWKSEHPYRDRWGFSKLVEQWIDDKFSVRLNKHRVMHKAVEITDAASIVPDKFRDLLEEMRKIGDSI